MDIGADLFRPSSAEVLARLSIPLRWLTADSECFKDSYEKKFDLSLSLFFCTRFIVSSYRCRARARLLFDPLIESLINDY